MKEHALGLSDSDRAALQSLVPLAGALGAGTIFALFFGGRKRRPELAVFEIFAVAAVFACVATTAYYAIAMLHQDEAIGSRDLTQAAAPLLIAAFLLIFISAFGRLGGSTERVLTLLPLVVVGIFLAFGLSALSWEVEATDTVEIAAVIIGVGIVFSLLVGAASTFDSRRGRRELQRRFVAFSERGFVPAERRLRLALPRAGEHEEVRLSGWERKGRFYIDVGAACRLERAVHARWDESVDELHRPVAAGPVLLEVAAPTVSRYLRRRRDLSVVRFESEGGGERATTFERLDLGLDHALFDVTELVGEETGAGP